MHDPCWIDFAFYSSDREPERAEAEERCIACIEASELTLLLDGEPKPVTAIRNVAVALDWRGRGLFRSLMNETLAWCEQTAGPVLLYSDDVALYERFGFVLVDQHRFVGPTPERLARPSANILGEDWTKVGSSVLRERLAARAPVSRRCGLVGASDLVLANLRAADSMIAFASDIDALIVHEFDDDTLVLVDIIASTIPPLAEITSRLPARPVVATLFSPDSLGWMATPVPDDTGLMARGPLPPAMRRPFMLPPTAEF